MLVIDEATAVAYSEQRVLDWMRAWSGQFIIVGLAISGCRLGDHEHTDLVVLTPRATIVMDVKGTAPEAREGVLSVRADGRWKLSGYDGDPLDDAESGAEQRPFDRVSSSISVLTELVRSRNPEAGVEGLVVVVPPGESDITVRVGAGRPRCGVVVAATAADLRAWFHRTANRAIVWSAEAAHELLTDLGAGAQVSVEDLIAEGFPSRARLDYLAGPEYAAAVSAARRYTEQRKQAPAESRDRDGVRVDDLRAGEEVVPAAFMVGAPVAMSRSNIDAEQREPDVSQPPGPVLDPVGFVVDRPRYAEGDVVGQAEHIIEEVAVPAAVAVGSVRPLELAFAVAPTAEPAPAPVSVLAVSASTPVAEFAAASTSDERAAAVAPVPLSVVAEGDGPEPARPPHLRSVPREYLPEPDRESEFTDDWSSWIGPRRPAVHRTEIPEPAWLDDYAPTDHEPRPPAAPAPSPAGPVAGGTGHSGGRFGGGLGDAARSVLSGGSARLGATSRRIFANANSRSEPSRPRFRVARVPSGNRAEPSVHRRQRIVALTLIATLLSTFWLLASACSTPHRSADDTRGLGSVSSARNAIPCSPDPVRQCAFHVDEVGLLTNY